MELREIINMLADAAPEHIKIKYEYDKEANKLIYTFVIMAEEFPKEEWGDY